MGALILISRALPAGWPADLLSSAAKAGFVGGIADWFAVTALFRHPLGLPIPHTAIIPNHKERLGRALGRFVASLLFEVKPSDFWSLALPLACFLLASVLAALPPSLRAARVDPIVALREE